MTIRRLWHISLIGIAILSITIYGIIMTSLTNKYFNDYMYESYSNHVEQILGYTKKALNEPSTSYSQMAIELETHVIDPIVRIKVYNEEGKLLADVNNDFTAGSMMMNGRTMNEMMGKVTSNMQLEVDQYEINDKEGLIATLNITRQSTVENTFVARLFKANLIKNSFKAVGLSVLLSLILGHFISKIMSKNLIDTAEIAQGILLNESLEIKKSNIKEVNIIRESLESLSIRLKLKQKSRKKLVDQLIHQTRTPMTVLRTHLEGVEDGLIALDKTEFSLLDQQIKDVTRIIENMSEVIDTETVEAQIELESLELGLFLSQIVKGLKTQFDHKGISVKLIHNRNVMVNTDRHILTQIVYNLLTNAYKYTEANGHVEVKFDDDNQFFKIYIKDNGIGISKEEQEKIFDAYYRGKRNPIVQGEGLGLYLVKENLKHLGGDVEVITAPNEGAEFILTIPKV